MEATSFTFADLSRFLKRAPKLKTYVIPTILFIVADYFVVRDISFTFFALILPLVLVVPIDRVLVYFARFNFPTRRIYYLDFLSFFFSEIYFIIIRLAFPGFLNLGYDIMLAFSTTALLRTMVFYTYYSDRYRKIVLPSMGYFVSTAIGLTFIGTNPVIYIFFALMTLIFSAGGYVFAHTSVSSFTNEFGQTPITILNFFLNSRGTQSKESDARAFFEKIYDKESEVPVQVVDITEVSGKRKVLLIFPYVHPGPFGNIGTSNIPFKLLSRLGDLSKDIMVFHTTTTNSNNSANEEDIDRITEAVKEALGKVEYVDTLSGYKKVNVGKHTLGLLRFGDYGIAVMIPERERFDDVSLSEGLRMIDELRNAGAKDFIALDAQIHFLQGAKPLEDCTKLIAAAKREFPNLIPKEQSKVGYASVTLNANAIGPLGIQCLFLEIEDKQQALILTDSNNVTDELIKVARKKCEHIVQKVDFFTTDNHFINAGTLDMNPLGQRDDPDVIADAIVECVSKARDDLSQCRIGMGTSSARVHMGEESTFQRLLDSVHSALRRARYIIGAIISACIFSTLLLSYYLFYFLLIN